jgi:hypothetical protein
MQMPTSVYENELRRNHQHRIRRRRVARSGERQACNSRFNVGSRLRAKQATYSQINVASTHIHQNNHGPGTNHHSDISRKAVARIIDNSELSTPAKTAGTNSPAFRSITFKCPPTGLSYPDAPDG